MELRFEFSTLPSHLLFLPFAVQCFPSYLPSLFLPLFIISVQGFFCEEPSSFCMTGVYSILTLPLLKSHAEESLISKNRSVFSSV